MQEESTHDLAYKVRFNDWDDAMGARPASLSITAYSGDVQVPFEVTAADGWAATVTLPDAAEDGTELKTWRFTIAGVPKAYTASVASASASSTTYTQDVTYRRITPKARAVWDDSSNAAQVRPASVDFTVKRADGQELPAGITATATVNASATSGSSKLDRSLDASFTLPQCEADGTTPIEYTVEQGELPACYATKATAFDPTGTTVFTNTLDSLDYTVKMFWDDNDNARGKRPGTVVITLLANGEPYTPAAVASVALEGTDESYTWTGLPRVDAQGQPIAWTVREAFMPIYDVIYYGETVDSAHEQRTDYGVPDEDADGNLVSTVRNVLRDDWNYAIDLKWDTPTASETYDRQTVTLSDAEVSLKYSLNISTSSRIYEPGEMQVRLPYALWRNRDGSANLPVDISVPQAPEKNTQFSFNYYLDKHDSDDPLDWEIVYTNWKRLEAGTNQTLQVIYMAKPSNTIDLSLASFTAKGHAKGDGQNDYEDLTSATITYQMDTGARISSITKTPYKLVYSASDLSYISAKDAGTLDTAHYNYVLWKYEFQGGANQNFKLTYTDWLDADDNGRIVAATGSPTIAADGQSCTWTEGAGAGQPAASSFSRSGYVLVAYARGPVDDSGVPAGGEYGYTDTYHNHVKTAVQAIDDDNYLDDEVTDYNDYEEREAQAQIEWEDYTWRWGGEIYAHYKSLYTENHYSINQIAAGQDVAFSARASLEVNGYNLDGWQMDFWDSDLYWNTTGYDKYADLVRMTPDDFEVTGLRVYFSYSDVDRSDGKTVDVAGYPDKPLEVYAQSGNTGAWEKVAEIPVTKRITDVTLEASLFAGKDYTGVRLVTPQGMQAHGSAAFYPTYRFKPESAKFKEYYDAGAKTIYIVNIASYKVFKGEADGSYTWFNKATTRKQSNVADGVGLFDEDLAREGAMVEHKSDRGSITRMDYHDSVDKQTVRYVNNPVNSTVDAVFDVVTMERADVSRADLPAATAAEMSFDAGTFYDLLPYGYRYNAKAGTKAQGMDGVGALITDVRTVDNWRGTGRQMVIFTIESLVGDGNNFGDTLSYQSYTSYNGSHVFSSSNYGNYAKTGWSIEFTATISWEELTYHRTGTNYVFYQDADLREFWGTPDDTWLEYGPIRDDGTFLGRANWSHVARYLADLDGGAAVADINGDGVTDAMDTLFDASPVNPSVAQTVELGIFKQVKGVSGIYSDHDMTTLDGMYSYKLDLVTSDNGITKDVILYDILENAANVEGNVDEIWWKGTFDHVSTALPQAQGVDVVVWYSTVEQGEHAGQLNYNSVVGTTEEPGTMGVQDDAGKADADKVWSTTPPADLSQVTAIAFDLRRAKDGSDFEFEGKTQTTMEIFMKAPSAMPENGAELAYNRLAYSSHYVPNGTIVPQDLRNIGRRVTIGLFTPQELSFQKLGEQVDAVGGTTGYAPLGGVQFQLYQCTSAAEGHLHTGAPGQEGSCWAASVVETRTSGKDGTVRFENLDTGSYAVVESSARSGYVKLDGYWTFDVDAYNGTVTDPVACGGAPDMAWDEGAGTWVLQNDQVRRSVWFKKEWKDDNVSMFRPDKVVFGLYRNGVKIDEMELSKSEASGEKRFENLPVYDAAGQRYTYTVKEESFGSDDYTSVQESKWSTGANSWVTGFTNWRNWGTIRINKTIGSGWTDAAKDERFTFEAAFTASDGKPLANFTMPVRYLNTDQNRVVLSIDKDVELSTDENGILTVPDVGFGHAAIITHIPDGTTYKVSEQQKDGWTVKNPYNASGTFDLLKKNYTGNMSINMDFSNSYRAAGTVQLEAFKTENGLPPEEGHAYTFQLQKHAIGYTNIETATTDADGHVVFKELSFTTNKRGEDVTEWYSVHEIGDMPTGISKDNNYYYYEVVWKDNGDGTVTPQVTVHRGSTSGEVLDAAVVKNTYPAKGTATVELSKLVDGVQPDASQAFSFTVRRLGTNGRELSMTYSKASGTASRSFSFTQADIGKEAVYELRETKGHDETLRYDTAVFVAKVTPMMAIAEDGSRYLDCTPVYYRVQGDDQVPVDAAVFNNESAAFDISGVKTWNDADYLDKEDYARPEAIQVTLTGTVEGEGEPVFQETRTVTADDDWAWEWTGLARFDDQDRRIVYEISEQGVEGYVVTQPEGTYDLVNTPTHENVDPETPGSGGDEPEEPDTPDKPDKPGTPDDDKGKPGKSGGTKATPKKPAKATTSRTPRTGDTLETGAAVAVALASAGLLVLALRRREKE